MDSAFVEYPYIFGTLFISASIAITIYFVRYITFATFEYEGAHVLITGGSSGIGFEMAKEYVKMKSHVTIVGRNLSKLASACSALKNFRISPEQKISFVALDVTSSEETVVKSLGDVVEAVGPISILVNSAGISFANQLEDLKFADIDSLFRTNVIGSILPTRFVIPAMKRCRKGKVIFIASQAAQVCIHGYTAYCASKWALRGLAEALQMEVKPYNISISIAYPPDTLTPGFEQEMLTKPEITKKLSESGSVFPADVVAKKIIRDSNLGRFHISIGLDGWLLRMLHPGMSPLNNAAEVIESLALAPVARFISIFYLYSWDRICASYASSTTTAAATDPVPRPPGADHGEESQKAAEDSGTEDDNDSGKLMD